MGLWRGELWDYGKVSYGIMVSKAVCGNGLKLILHLVHSVSPLTP